MELYTDAARGDEVVGLGWEIILSDEKREGNRYIEATHTSMEAEYYALIDGLRHARRHGTDEIAVFVDCKPLVKKMRVPDTDKDWYDRRQGCHRLLNKFDRWELDWTPRSTNSSADRLAYQALESGRRKI
jgi:ribonuclease HI